MASNIPGPEPAAARRVHPQARFLDLLRGYVSFAEEKTGPVKRIAKPHQYFAVEKVVRRTVEATRSNGKAGVVWHTQGSGKFMEMELYAHQIATHPSLGSPTIVVIPDRTDLDDQLYSTFAASKLLPETPVRGGYRARDGRAGCPGTTQDGGGLARPIARGRTGSRVTGLRIISVRGPWADRVGASARGGAVTRDRPDTAARPTARSTAARLPAGRLPTRPRAVGSRPGG